MFYYLIIFEIIKSNNIRFKYKNKQIRTSLIISLNARVIVVSIYRVLKRFLIISFDIFNISTLSLFINYNTLNVSKVIDIEQINIW